MSCDLTTTATCVVASAADFVREGLPPKPSVALEGLWYEVLGSQAPHDAAIAEVPVTVSMLEGWTLQARTSWMLNNFLTDERYATAWNLAQQLAAKSPIDFSLEIERVWQKRAAETWPCNSGFRQLDAN